ncbi:MULTISPECIES: DUF421 domain-containing protein [Variovorax]|uniref:DUF421 domain-containing protein n=1 Tax=Variovorax TaxID=34072 RepID=UPI0008ABF71B|nr:YetF domain-containing protein [Variovorax sp. OV084]SEU23246.1 Protein of unknown function [Variovorax sp. OV084]
MKQEFEWIFGTGSDLETWQMAARAIAVFFIALVLIRASGRRSFGQHSPFDACITVLLGAVLSRAVVGASPFWSTIAAGTALVVVHRAVALGSARWAAFEDVVNGREITLVRDAHLDQDAMRKALVSRRNLDEAVRQKLGDADLSSVRLAMLERDGKITVIGIDRATP